MIANKFYFLVNFIRPTGPMITMVTRYTGGLFQLLLVKMSWEKNSMEKLMIENNYHFLPKFIAPPPKFCQFLHVLFSDTPPPPHYMVKYQKNLLDKMRTCLIMLLSAERVEFGLRLLFL